MYAIIRTGGKQYRVQLGEQVRVEALAEWRLTLDFEDWLTRMRTPADKVEVLRAYLHRWKAEVGVFFEGVSAKSPESELRRIAPNHPVFIVQTLDTSQDTR